MNKKTIGMPTASGNPREEVILALATEILRRCTADAAVDHADTIDACKRVTCGACSPGLAATVRHCAAVIWRDAALSKLLAALAEELVACGPDNQLTSRTVAVLVEWGTVEFCGYSREILGRPLTVPELQYGLPPPFPADAVRKFLHRHYTGKLTVPLFPLTPSLTDTEAANIIGATDYSLRFFLRKRLIPALEFGGKKNPRYRMLPADAYKVREQWTTHKNSGIVGARFNFVSLRFTK